MLKKKDTQITAGTIPGLSDDSIRIRAGSFVIDNRWVSFRGVVFKIRDYINSVLRGNRTRFFKDRGYAVYLIVGLHLDQGIKVAEGAHVKFTSVQSVPPPSSFDFVPMAGVVLVQDGTSDLNFGYKPLKNENIIFYSGFGNVLDKDLQGVKGPDSYVYGSTGLQGLTGLEGYTGIIGDTGAIGETGITPPADRGETGLRGSTGINWDIHIPFEEFT